MAQWQKTNVNFSGANGALAVASGSFSKAGGLALQISDQIRKQEAQKAQNAALNNSAIQNQAKVDYLLDTVERNKRVEADQYKLAIKRQADKNNKLIGLSDKVATDAQGNVLTALNEDVNKHRVSPDMPGYAQLPGQEYTEQQLDADGKPVMVNGQPVIVKYKVDGYTQNKFNTLPEGIQKFDRNDFVPSLTKELMATGLYDLQTATQLAQAEANKRIGALPSADVIKNKNNAVTHTYDARMNILANATKSKGKGGTNITVNGTGTRGTGGSGYTTYTDANNPEINDKWITEKFTKSRGLFDGLANVFSDDMALNQNIMRKNQAEYVTDYGVTPAQYRAFMNGVVQDGVIGDGYAPETIFEGTPKQRFAIAAKMKKYGHDKTIGKVPTINGLANPAATPKAQYKQFKTVLAKGDEVTQAYLQDINRSYQAATPKSKSQIIATFRNNQIKLMQSQLKDAPLSTVVKPKDTPLFADKKNPISVAMSKKDAPGTSSLVQLLKKDPTAYSKAAKGLTQAERNKVSAYMKTPGFKKIMTAYSKHQITSGGNNDTQDTTDNTTVVQPAGKGQMGRTPPVQNGAQRIHGGGHGANRTHKPSKPAPRMTQHTKKPSMPMKDIQKYYRMSDNDVSRLPKSEVIKIMSDYNLPAEIRRKLSLRLY